jgi:hypothetical protein
MHIRFVTAKRDSQSGRRQGLFYAAYELEARLDVSLADRNALDEIHNWFSKNMWEPTRATRSSRPNRTATAISWFREEAIAHVSKMRELQAVLEKYGIFAETLRTTRPGYIVYEDKYQVVAYPFADTPT